MCGGPLPPTTARDRLMLIEWLRLGGVPMGLLLLLSLVAATIVIVKLWEFWEWRAQRPDFAAQVLDAWRRQRSDQALTLLRAERTPLATVLETALIALTEPGVSEGQARERALAGAQAVLERMRGGLRVLELIAQIAPLLGLFGTVLGMIEAFRALQDAGGDVQPALLAGGIWRALLTTAAGLAVAMPVMAVLTAFERTLDGQRMAMETALTELFTAPQLSSAPCRAA